MDMELCLDIFYGDYASIFHFGLPLELSRYPFSVFLPFFVCFRRVLVDMCCMVRRSPFLFLFSLMLTHAFNPSCHFYSLHPFVCCCKRLHVLQLTVTFIREFYYYSLYEKLARFSPTRHLTYPVKKWNGVHSQIRARSSPVQLPLRMDHLVTMLYNKIHQCLLWVLCALKSFQGYLRLGDLLVALLVENQSIVRKVDLVGRGM
jgi:hypothetical protein